MKRPLPLVLYGLGAGLAEPFAPWLLRRRAARGKEDPLRLGERLGRAAAPRPEGPLVWIHGASVGESLSHIPVVERLRAARPDLAVLVTSGTRTSAELLARRLPEGVIHQYAPIDAPGAARRFVAHWRPELAVFVESELWPNLLLAAEASGARLALLGARLSETSMRRWDSSPAAARALLGLFDLIWTQSSETREWIERHGMTVAGMLDLKRLAAPLPCDAEALAQLQSAVANRPVVVAASTHPGEEELIAETLQAVGSEPLLVIAPRHPERGPEVAAMLKGRGWSLAVRSKGEPVTPETRAYLADTLGELGLLYRLAHIVVLGGSFREGLAGHNPFEPARLGKPVITGPHVDAFADAYAELIDQRAVLMAHDAAELQAGLKALLAEPGVARELGARGQAVTAQGGARFDEMAAELISLLPPP